MSPREFQSTYTCATDDIELLRLALGFVIYFTGDLGSHRRALTAAIDAAWPLVEPGARSFQTTNMKRTKPVKNGKNVLLQMLDDRPSEMHNWVSVDNRRHLDEAPDCCLQVSEDGYGGGGYLLCRLPVGEDSSPAAILRLVLTITEQWDFAHGYAGYTLALNTFSLKAGLPKRMYYGIGMRHPGIDLPSADNTSFVIRDGIKRINWLTLLGPEMVRRAGSLNGLGRQHGVVLHKTGPGVVIQAGEAPLIGDTNRRDTCEVYRQVGRALKHIRCQNHPAFIIGQGEFVASDEKTQTWLASLDD